jgi:glycosyltransferase involved in cell wall biosynthesis
MRTIRVPGTRPRILIVEDQAHVQWGHFPVMFTELARALVDGGFEVTVLTSRGWVLEDASGPQPFDTRELGTFALSVHNWTERFDRSPRRRVRRLVAACRDLVMVVSARLARRKLGGADLIVTSISSDPWRWSAFSGSGRTVVYQFHPPVVGPPGALLALARRAERRRRSVGDGIRIAVNNDDTRRDWESAAPWIETRRLPFTAARVVEPEPDARRLLGLEIDIRLALLFGASHDNKDHEVVWRAFGDLAGWRLVIAGGGAADAYMKWREQSGPVAVEPILFDGYANDQLRHLLHSASDLAVLSFRAGARLDSGTLVDAIAYGLPVVCSDECFAGTAVADLLLGAVFASGDPKSLAEAVHAVPETLDPAVIANAQGEHSARRLAAMHLEALGRKLAPDLEPGL